MSSAIANSYWYKKFYREFVRHLKFTYYATSKTSFLDILVAVAMDVSKFSFVTA